MVVDAAVVVIVVIVVIVARAVEVAVGVIVIPEADVVETAMIAEDDVTVMIPSEMMMIDSHRTSATMMMAQSHVVEAVEVTIGSVEIVVTAESVVKGVVDVSVSRASRLSLISRLVSTLEQAQTRVCPKMVSLIRSSVLAV
jgi:hypothetical protein